MEPKTIKIDEIEYVRKEDVNKLRPIVVDGCKSIASASIGMKVIVRSSNEGINCGIVEAADETGVILNNSRRLWYHKPADKSISWYEGVAMSGLSDDSKVSTTVKRKFIVEDYSITSCSDVIFDSIMKKTPHAQS